MRSEFDSELEARLVRYAEIDSQSDADSASQPSTDIQLDMSRLLVAELTEMGAQDVRLTDYGVVLASIPATAEGPVMGWCAHVDTAPQFNASGVKPVVHRGYNGGDITFADAPDLKLSPENSPYLGQKQGEDIITASGLTLLGGDDKAGVAIAMTAARHLLENPQIKHGKIRLAFTPDEEIGRGVDPRLPADFGVDFAYTFDGGKPGEIEFETFSADGAVVRVTGVSAHPGFAKDKMVNALHLVSKIVMTLPQVTMTPDTTEGTEGFIHVSEINGGSSAAEIVLIIRDFELEGLAAKGDLLRQVCAAVAAGEPRAQITCEITPQYRNMRYWLEKDMTPVELVRAAVKDAGLDPVSVPIRGGTDGSRLTEMGVPCPNVFTGMQEIHGPLEWISVQDMARATQVAIALAQRAVT
ncbi:peptidase T [Sulfitobacter geojensis]|uniref:Peptidase T n=1 Tax=Sulfitobacter geojensis TaxID=1342299 RepID=A0AAE3B4Z3_9RHOB|nr:peptidase T [Sulfitobacter geojensis]MBM1687664.1 peptidase T [Sulfitobacter geojensis]MBM1691731.1 peptidase T [Sulfitobacter geojensis]MBM1703897.1 peptidase T [Sulfitobacter geojensis]MBM1707955.1 peptidase T [Sulfitobacter geojensis]MBM1712020.1 peptidase T [Sulfitobacter geojensis]